EADHPSRPHPEHGARVAACTQGAVHNCIAALDRQGGDDLVDQHRNMRGMLGSGVGHEVTPRSSSRKRAISLRSSGIWESLISSSPFLIWNVSAARRKSA